MNYENLCIFCMREKKSQDEVCPYCGSSNETYKKSECALPPFTILNGRYLVGKTIGAGGFGITYLAMDLALERRVAIKEFFMSDAMFRTSASAVTVSMTGEAQEEMYHSSREKFEREAKILAHLNNMPGIVQVYDFFQENGTAYIVMEYLDGKTLGEYVKENGGVLSFEETRRILSPIMKSLEKIHKEGILHRDISPDNIKFSEDGSLKLFDFGGAKLETNDGLSKVAYMKPGYTPLEQYSVNGEQGPWTDVYAMAATIYYCICGKKPPEAPQRSCGNAMLTFETPGTGITKAEEYVVRKGLTLRCDLRYQTMGEFLAALAKVTENLPEKKAAEPIQKKADEKKAAEPVQKKVDEKKAAEPAQKNSDEKHAPVNIRKNWFEEEKEDTSESKKNTDEELVKKGLIVVLVWIGIIIFLNIMDSKSGESEKETKQSKQTVVVSEGTTKQSRQSSETEAAGNEKAEKWMKYVVTECEDKELSCTYLYEKPSSEEPAVLLLKKNNIVEISETMYMNGEEWGYARYFGCSGWVNKEFLKEVGNMEADNTELGRYYISVEETNLRSQPDDAGPSIGTLKYGATIRLDYVRNGWAYVYFSRQSKYISGCRESSESAGYIDATCITKYIFGSYVVNTSENSGVLLREKPQVEADNKIRSIPGGTKLQITWIKNGWGKTAYGGSEGWVMMKYLYLDSKKD